MSGRPPSAMTSASPSVPTVMPVAPRSICSRARATDLCVLTCGRRAIPRAATASAIRRAFRSTMSRSITSAGVSRPSGKRGATRLGVRVGASVVKTPSLAHFRPSATSQPACVPFTRRTPSMTEVDIPVADGLPASMPATRFAAHSASLRERLKIGSSWALLAQLGVLGLAAVLYLYNLSVSGFANTYYTMAAQAASQSWSAWFWGSLDAANFITLDKPPLATMLMGLSVRLFGLSSWSILLPEALCGIATVALLFVAVRRYFGPVAATIAGLVMALTPVSVLIFRYDNPDALLTLLLVGAAAVLLRGLEDQRLR